MGERINIWGKKIPYNNSESKYKDMEIKGTPNVVFQLLRFVGAIKGTKYKDAKRKIDTFTYVSEIKRGFAKDTYEDVPYLTPFLVDGSDRAVIIVPGGGYAYKSSDFDGEAKQGEGDMVAKKLNEAGISAFVLWYRSNPYRMPIPLLDIQRAVRYVRYHAEKFNLNPAKIGVIGFSAGGFQVAGLVNLLRHENVTCEGYEQDAVDQASDRVAFAGLIYPCINFKYNVPMLFSAFPAEQVRNQDQRQKLLEKYDCIKHVQENDPPQFICYGTKDTLVNPAQSEQYIEALEKKGVSYRQVVVKGAQHGFGARETSWLESFVEWIDESFE